MDHRKLCGPVGKSKKQRRMNENTSVSEQVKVGLVDEAIVIVSSG